MRVGFVTQLLWDRFGPLWTRLVADVGAEVVLPPAARGGVESGRLGDVPGIAFRLAVAQALALADCDLLIVPDLNPGPDQPRGGGQDPWVASFPAALVRSVGALPPVVAVPAAPDGDLEGLAVEILLRINRDVVAARRSWQRHRGLARAAAAGADRWPAAPPGVRTVAVVCQPWLASDALAEAVLAASGEGTARARALAQSVVDPAVLRREGARIEPDLVGTDLEALGAARLFARRGGIDDLRLVLDLESGADAWLGRRIETAIHKPFTVVPLQDLPDPETLIAHSAER